ncbi:hypothetical protein V2J52_11475 [Georgenia sp. MJ173]|uniref:hypothetical protein n=1 Tax=Georgenia sunbinii TaxID=3117728 RepID=UPI002F25FEF7
MSARRTRTTAFALAAVVALAGCTSSDDPDDAAPDPTDDPGPQQAELQLPAGPATVLAEDEPAALAVAASSAFFSSAPVVVLAEADDLGEVLRGAGAGVALAAPVLLTGDDAAVAAELDRLGTEAVLAFGGAQLPDDAAAAEDAAAAGDVATDASATEDDDAADDATGSSDDTTGHDVLLVPAPADDAALAELLGLAATEQVTVTPGAEIEGVMALSRGELTPVAIDEPAEGDAESPESEPEDGADGEQPADEEADGAGAAAEDTRPDDADAAPDVGETEAGASDAPTNDATPAPPSTAELPPTEPAEPLTGVLALSSGSSDDVAAAATASAAGATLAVAPGGDPRASSEAIAVVAEAGVDVVVGLGAAFEDDETLGWRVTTAATGTELPGGGQLVFPGKRYVALYGTPSTTALGVLGEQDVPGTIARAAEHAADYDELSDEPVVPALEIITTVASSSAGSDGNYSNELPAESLRPLIEAAGEAGQYVVLDLQPGRSSFLEQAQHYAELLEYPHVGLALDPEWNLGPDEVHMVQIGSTTAAEVNEVVDWLADFTRERALPQKMLVLHQFQVRMIQTVADVDLSRSEIAVLVHADGQGGQSAKQGTWATLHANAPDIEWWGWKNFYDEDIPMLTPQETALVEPFPNFISYQ